MNKKTKPSRQTKPSKIEEFADFPKETKLYPRIARRWLKAHGEENRSYPAWHWIYDLQKIAQGAR